MLNAQLPEHFDRTGSPVATHRFWAAKNWFPTDTTRTGGNYVMFPEPLAVKPTAHGLEVGYGAHIEVSPTYFVHPAEMDLTIGAEHLDVASVPILARTDRTIDLGFGPLRTRIGRGLPFVYVETDGTSPTITFASAPTIFGDEGSFLGATIHGKSYGLFCPRGGRWLRTANAFTCSLPTGRHYMSVALLPDASDLANYARYAFSFPIYTDVSWIYDETQSQVETTFRVQSRAMEGTETGVLQVLYPHQYARLKDTAGLTDRTYRSARGALRVYTGSSFVTVNRFHGLLPFLPLAASSASGRVQENALLKNVAEEPQSFPSQDTYGAGKRLNRLAQLLPLAALSGDEASLSALKQKLRAEFDSWTVTEGGSGGDRVFRYNREWGTLIGYPASYGSDTQLNDHHFHYGYWIHAAALLGFYDPEWINSRRTSALLRELVGDIAETDAKSTRYPFLRHFDAYAGHSWASGQAPFADGGNQESTSEAVNAWAGIALYAAETNDLKLRNAAIWMYTLESDAAFDYWFNAGPVHTFPEGFTGVQISNLFDGKSDAATWFGSQPAFEHGIQFLPFTGASLYLGRDAEYSRRNLAEVTRAEGGRSDAKSAPWPDLMQMYEGFFAPTEALKQWQSTEFTFDGESRAHERAWLESMQALGQVDPSVVADTPYYAVFTSGPQRTHVAFNPGNTLLLVHFSDGAVLAAKPRAITTDSAAVLGSR